MPAFRSQRLTAGRLLTSGRCDVSASNREPNSLPCVRASNCFSIALPVRRLQGVSTAWPLSAAGRQHGRRTGCIAPTCASFPSSHLARSSTICWATIPAGDPGVPPTCLALWTPARNCCKRQLALLPLLEGRSDRQSLTALWQLGRAIAYSSTTSAVYLPDHRIAGAEPYHGDRACALPPLQGGACSSRLHDHLVRPFGTCGIELERMAKATPP